MRPSMISDRIIVCIASSWYGDPTSKHHVMRLLSERNHVIWVNYHASRRPRLSKGDFATIWQKVGQARRGVDRITPQLQVLTPLLLPFPGLPGVRAFNRAVLVRQLRSAIRRLGSRPIQIWSFAPDVSFLAGQLDEEFLLYYCVDEFSEFEGYDKELVLSQERELMDRADLVVTTARALQASKSPLHPNTHLVPHGVDWSHFAPALSEEVEVPAEIRDLPGPVLGFFGLISDWVDRALLERVARQRPDWTLVLIGSSVVDVSALEALPNVHLLGRRPYESLPAYAKGFDLALIPFVVNELTRNTNPIKLREYLSAGCPVVSTPLPEVELYREHVDIADADGFVEACARALDADSPELRRSRSRSMQDESWPAKVELLSDLVDASPRPRAATNDA